MLPVPGPDGLCAVCRAGAHQRAAGPDLLDNPLLQIFPARAYRATVRDYRRIACGSATGKPAAEFKHREYHKIAIEQPMVVC